MIFNKFYNYIHHIHIPRTGGRFVTELLRLAGYNDIGNGWTLFEGKQVTHLTYQQAQRFYLTQHWTNNSFSVVRDPINRFISGLEVFKRISCIENLDVLEDYDYFLWLMYEKELMLHIDQEHWEHFSINYKGLINTYVQFFVPQHTFIDCSTMLWKFEDGLDENFLDWLRSEVKLDIPNSIKCKDVKWPQRSFDNYNYNVSEKVRENIYNFYKKDYDLLYNYK